MKMPGAHPLPPIPMPISTRKLSLHPLWNFFLLTLGAAFIGFGVQGIAAHQGFLTGGILGLGLLTWYTTDLLSAPIWTLIFNIPLFIFSWFFVSRRFMLYSVYGTLAVFVWSNIFNSVHLPIENGLYAAILAGVLSGAGGGIMLRTLGSGGGLDLLGVYLNKRWNIPIGQFFFTFNSALFLFSTYTIALDLVIVSFIQIFISSSATDYVLRLFNQRKMVMIITSRGQDICNAIIATQGRATIVPAYGGYSHDPKEVVMTITNNYTLSNLENMVVSIDPQAMVIVENTFSVSGAQYPRKSL